MDIDRMMADLSLIIRNDLGIADSGKTDFLVSLESVEESIERWFSQLPSLVESEITSRLDHQRQVLHEQKEQYHNRIAELESSLADVKNQMQKAVKTERERIIILIYNILSTGETTAFDLIKCIRRNYSDSLKEE